MAERRQGVIPAALRQAEVRFEVWQRTRERGTRIPKKLWNLAIGLAQRVR